MVRANGKTVVHSAIQVFGVVMDISATAISEAIERREFSYYFQPQISLISGRLTGAEALLRWTRADGTMIPPDRFIPLAEENGLMAGITISLFDSFVEAINLIRDINPDVLVSLNLSSGEFFDGDLLDVISSAVNHGLIPAGSFGVEITERTFLELQDKTRNYISYLSAMGIPIIMDDFGTGYSNLASLSTVPFAKIKLDRSLVKDVMISRKDAIIVEENIRMAHRIGVEVVAEGVESREIYGFLQQLGTTHVQGYLVGRPMPLGEFMETVVVTGKNYGGTALGLLYMAQLDHIQWRKMLINRIFYRDFVTSSQSNAYQDIQINPQRCSLGKWLEGEGKAYQGLPEFQALRLPHDRLHMVAHHLIVESDSGVHSRKQLIGLARELTDQSMLLVRLLHDLEHRILEEEMGLSHEPVLSE